VPGSAYLGSTREAFDNTIVFAIEAAGLDHFILERGGQ
jgi:hypothetical protein